MTGGSRTSAMIVDVDYRRSLDYCSFVPLKDCWEAFEFIHANPSSLSVDPNRISWTASLLENTLRRLFLGGREIGV